MDRRSLEEYSRREKVELDKLTKCFYEGKFGFNDSYPPVSRFVNTKYPITYSCQGKTIYPQVPMTGSLRILLVPSQRVEIFEKIHGFKIKDIPRLVDFANETGRVQFVLATDPEHYEGLDYLDPILIELNPPLATRIPIGNVFSSLDECNKHLIEFHQVAAFRFMLMLKRLEGLFNVDRGAGRDIFWEGNKNTYLLLRALEKNDLAEHILNSLLDNPTLAFALLSVYGRFLTIPILNPDRINHNYDFQSIVEDAKYLKKADMAIPLSNIRFPCEIGSFLMRKRGLCPQSFDSMKSVLDVYTHEELYGYMQDMNEAIVAKSPDLLEKRASDIGEILDNVWSDAKSVRKQIKGVDFGISFACGIVGPVVGYLSANLVGLLVALGLVVTEKSTDFFGGIGASIVRKLRQGYVVNIYDFQNKHPIE